MFKSLTEALNIEYPIDFTEKQVNDKIQKLVKEAYKKLTEALKKEINGPAVIVYPDKVDPSVLHFTYANWNRVRFNENKIAEIFDWNTATVKVSFDGIGNPDADPIYGNPPRSYKKFQAICYGMGRRGNQWRGSRIVLAEEK